MTTSPHSPTALGRPAALTADLDQTAPNAARIYDYLLGGSGHYDADRQAARRLLIAVPEARRAARDNRAFLGRARERPPRIPQRVIGKAFA